MKTLKPEDRELYGKIMKRALELRTQHISSPNLVAMQEFTAQATAQGWTSPNELWGAVVQAGKVAARQRVRNKKERYHPKSQPNGASTTALDAYKAFIVKDGDFTLDDEKIAPIIGCRVVSAARIRSKLKCDGYEYTKVRHGYEWKVPKKPMPTESDRPTNNGTEPQLSLPMDHPVESDQVVEPVSKSSTSKVTLSEKEMHLVRIFLAGMDMIKGTMVGQFWNAPSHPETVVRMDNFVALLTNLYVQNDRHHQTLCQHLDTMSSEQRQLRALVAQLLQKWS